jgi:hypothetical protein
MEDVKKREVNGSELIDKRPGSALCCEQRKEVDLGLYCV